MMASRVLVTTILAIVVAAYFNSYFDESVRQVRTVLGKSYQSKPYEFRVSEDGALVRFEVYGNMPDNTWKSVEFEVFDPNEQYLFTLSRELWTETGRDSEGFWRESQGDLDFTIRLAEAGIYNVVLHVSNGPHSYGPSRKKDFRFKVTELRGDAAAFLVLLFILVPIALLCGVIVFKHIEMHNKYGSRNDSYDLDFKPVGWLLALYSVLLIFAYFLAQNDSEADIDYHRKAAYKKHLAVDRHMREHSLSSAGYRTRSGVGGK
ncbi:hypothetical protein [Pseudoalteromonas sp. Of7M-16]|uniref:hypothetical protein n=1 Tax=Pseudoalteromonas sp. Of7M-16 TaxID=2917756 RepID=UPI001EF66626|nr:hypothetical protein [Pseudoalteromonas sp. Of7M-16]MCG7549966.1 hypothetical protein [Pseudoalteromonas sp. Of7M-16]